eukprot:TRINITY_DN29379_c0_g1_i1.p1 TRINITY_DN29379_c0_g1~~TRINITY_DN29379_c0_g1_i1.p1  ORF type:complete len:330 (+),score=26.64 TRINITY_DN29379_c0_g1_i1:79-990(+)
MSIAVLYPNELEFTDEMYIWADLGLVFPMILLIPTLAPRKDLSRGRPESNLWSLSVLVGVYGQCALIIGFQLLAQQLLHMQSWYDQPAFGAPGFNERINMNSTESALFSSFQYVFLAAAVSQSFGRFRVHLLRSFGLCGVLVAQFFFCSLFVLYPSTSIMNAFGFVSFSAYPIFKITLWAMALGNGLLFILYERFAVRHKSDEPDTANADDLLRQAVEWQTKEVAAAAAAAGSSGSGPHRGSSPSSSPLWIGPVEDDMGRTGGSQSLLAFWRDAGGSCYPVRKAKDVRYMAAQEEAGGVWNRL